LQKSGGLPPCFQRLYYKPSFALDSSTCCPWLFWDILYEQWHISIFKDDIITNIPIFVKYKRKKFFHLVRQRIPNLFLIAGVEVNLDFP
jgi:hypothetical protein